MCVRVLLLDFVFCLVSLFHFGSFAGTTSKDYLDFGGFYRFWGIFSVCVFVLLFGFAFCLYRLGLFAGTTSKEYLGITEINTVRQ